MAVKVNKDVEYNDSLQHNRNGFPLIVVVIFIAEFCERFSYSGMKAFLALYLKSKLMYTDDEATEIYHYFCTLTYFFPIFGAMLADSYLGKFKTILYMMFVYALGNIVVAITAIPVLGLPGRLFTMLGLFLITIGTGGIKPCVSAFGGDQFTTAQKIHLDTYFMLLYFTICSGSLFSKAVSPILRSEIQCFGDKDCYSIAFGAPGLIMMVSIIIYIIPRKIYVIKKPSGNVILEAIKCVFMGLKNKVNGRPEQDEELHWLDSTNQSFDKEFIANVKKTLSILTLYIPLPIFWALMDQMGSRWTLQASKMDGNIGIFTIKPDQMQVLAPIVILIAIPIFQKLIYPLLAKVNLLKEPLERLTVGGILAVFAFICSGLVELNLQKTYPQLPGQNNSQLRIFNGLYCPLLLNTESKNITINPLDLFIEKDLSVIGIKELNYTVSSGCSNNISQFKFIIKEEKANSFYVTTSNVYSYYDEVAKSRSGLPLVRFLIPDHLEGSKMILYDKLRQRTEVHLNQTGVSGLFEVFVSDYSLKINGSKLMDMKLKTGGVYTILHTENGTKILEITPPNSVSVLYLLPQFIIMSISEVLFAVTGTAFSFNEAPESMKSVMQAAWLLTEACGNIIIIVVTRLAVRYDQVWQSCIYSIMMIVSMVVFIVLARNYKMSEREKCLENKQSRKIRSNSEALYLSHCDGN